MADKPKEGSACSLAPFVIRPDRGDVGVWMLGVYKHHAAGVLGVSGPVEAVLRRWHIGKRCLVLFSWIDLYKDQASI